MFVFGLVCITLCPFYFYNYLEGEERKLVALLLLSNGCLVTVNVFGSFSPCHGLVCSV